MHRAFSARRIGAALVVLAVAGAAVATAATSPALQPAAGVASSHLTLLSLSVGGHPLSIGDLDLASGTTDGSSAFSGLTALGQSYGTKSVSAGSIEVPSINSDTVLPASVSRLVTVVTPGASMTAGVGTARAGLDSFGSVRILGLPLALDGTASTITTVDGLHAGSEKTLVLRNLALPSISGLLGSLGLDISKLPSTTLMSLVDRLELVNGTITDARAALDAALGPLQPQLTAAQQQVADAQTAVDAAKADVTTTTSQLAGATSTLDAATQSLQAALGTAPHLLRAALLGLPSPSPLTIPTVLPSPSPLSTALPTALPTDLPTTLPTALPTDLATSLPTALPTDLPTTLPTTLPSALPTTLPSLPAVLPSGTQALVDAYDAAAAAYTDALNQLNAATGALNLANGLLNTASSAVNALLATVQTQVDALVHAVLDVLGRTPLVSVDSFTIRTEASATSAAKGGQTAQVVGGEIQGVHVLGTDVLSKTLGTDRIDLGHLAGAPLDLLSQGIDAVTGRLATALSAVPGLPTLSVPAPQIELLSASTATNITGGFGAARTTLKALQITMPAMTVPAAVQEAAPVGALSTKAIGDVLTNPLSVAVGTMQDTASFRPATNTGVVPPNAGGSLAGPTGSNPTGSNPTGSGPDTSTPNGSTPNGTPIAGGPAGNPQLPRTGLPAGLALLALGLVGSGLLLSRRAVDT